MLKEEAINLLISVVNFEPFSVYDSFLQERREELLAGKENEPPMTHEQKKELEAGILYDFLVEKGIINVEIIHKVDTESVLLVEDGSVDCDRCDRLEKLGFIVIPYRQGSELPQWLKK